jgi:DNA polymerase-1
MRMRTDLPLPDLNSARLPLDLAGMRRVLIGYGIHLGPSLWALTGGTPPPIEAPAPPPQPWKWTRRSRATREPIPGQLALF